MAMKSLESHEVRSPRDMKVAEQSGMPVYKTGEMELSSLLATCFDKPPLASPNLCSARLPMGNSLYQNFLIPEAVHPDLALNLGRRLKILLRHTKEAEPFQAQLERDLRSGALEKKCGSFDAQLFLRFSFVEVAEEEDAAIHSSVYSSFSTSRTIDSKYLIHAGREGGRPGSLVSGITKAESETGTTVGKETQQQDSKVEGKGSKEGVQSEEKDPGPLFLRDTDLKNEHSVIVLLNIYSVAKAKCENLAKSLSEKYGQMGTPPSPDAALSLLEEFERSWEAYFLSSLEIHEHFKMAVDAINSVAIKELTSPLLSIWRICVALFKRHVYAKLCSQLQMAFVTVLTHYRAEQLESALFQLQQQAKNKLSQYTELCFSNMQRLFTIKRLAHCFEDMYVNEVTVHHLKSTQVNPKNLISWDLWTSIDGESSDLYQRLITRQGLEQKVLLLRHDKNVLKAIMLPSLRKEIRLLTEKRIGDELSAVVQSTLRSAYQLSPIKDVGTTAPPTVLHILWLPKLATEGESQVFEPDPRFASYVYGNYELFYSECQRNERKRKKAELNVAGKQELNIAMSLWMLRIPSIDSCLEQLYRIPIEKENRSYLELRSLLIDKLSK